MKSWKGINLLDKLIAKSENAVYYPTRKAAHTLKKGVRVSKGKKCLIIGAGPCGIRAAIEMAFLGGDVHVIDSRKEFFRNNILHLWPFCIADLKALGAKSFFGKFCSGAIDHCSIRRLQLILLKVALLLGVQFTREIYCQSLGKSPNGDWKIRVLPETATEISESHWDCIVDATGGSANTASVLSPDLDRKEFRGLLAIGITVNFVNGNTQAEMNVEEISGVASIYKQHFFAQLRNATGIDLENIVYYKDETHYFVMTARTKSLLARGVFLKNYDNSEALLDRSNIDPEKLQSYASDAANFATQYKLPKLEMAKNSRGNPDVSIFDFTSRYHARYASVIRRSNGNDVLGLLVGDSLINPFWPTGTGIGKGFLGVFDACWTFREFCMAKLSPARILQERELIYKLLDQTESSRINKKFAEYTLDPKTRYLNIQSVVGQWDNTQILFLEEDKNGKRRSLAPNKAPVSKKQRGNTIKEQEVLIYSWLKSVIKMEKKYCNVGLLDLPWKQGDILLDLIRRLRPDLIDSDTESQLKTPKAKVS